MVLNVVVTNLPTQEFNQTKRRFYPAFGHL